VTQNSEVPEDDWTKKHYVTRNSTTDDPSGYRVWMTCRCGWDSGTLPDGNLPTTHKAELEHYASVSANELLDKICSFNYQEDLGKIIDKSGKFLGIKELNIYNYPGWTATTSGQYISRRIQEHIEDLRK